MRYVIVANGPFLPRDIITEVITEGECKIVALDGAADKLAKRGILPDVILGDFDSIENPQIWGIPNDFMMNTGDETQLRYVDGKYNVRIVHTPDQNKTDLAKAIDFCDQRPAKATRIDVLCAIDGRIDHTLGNIRSLVNHYNLARELWLHSEAYSLRFVKDNSITIQPQSKEMQQCAILGMPAASFISTGLAWNGESTDKDSFDMGANGYKVFPGHDSSCNLLNKDGYEATISISGQAIVIQPGLFPSQKQYNETHFDKAKRKAFLQEQLDYELMEITESRLKSAYNNKKRKT